MSRADDLRSISNAAEILELHESGNADLIPDGMRQHPPRSVAALLLNIALKLAMSYDEAPE